MSELSIAESIKQDYEEEIESLNESITWWTNRFNAVERDNRELRKETERLKEEYVMLQNASDEVEEELENRIVNAIKFIEARKSTQEFRKNKWKEKEVNIDIVLEQYRDILEILKKENKDGER